MLTYRVACAVASFGVMGRNEGVTDSVQSAIRLGLLIEPLLACVALEARTVDDDTG